MTIELKAIKRYPVKGMRGVDLAEAKISAHHMITDDRRFVIATQSSVGQEGVHEWARKSNFLQLVNTPKLAEIGTEYDDATTTLTILRNGRAICKGKLDDAMGRTVVEDFLKAFLKNDVAAENIAWIMPRDSWILDRAQIQPTLESIGTALASQLMPGAESNSIDDLFARVSGAGGLLRIDDTVKPTMYRCATVTKAELEQLKRIKNIVRMGRVKAIDGREILMEDGSVPTDPNTLHIDCAGDGLAKRPAVPIFENKKITLQSVRTCQQVFSAALIGHVEASYQNDDEKNDLCKVVAHPNTDIDFLRNNLADSINQDRWAQEPELQRWLQNCRLDFTSHVLNSNPSIKILAFLSKFPFLPIPNRINAVQQKATQNIERLLGNLDS